MFIYLWQHIIVCALLMIHHHTYYIVISQSIINGCTFLSDIKGCYTKNDIAYFGRNGSKKQKKKDPLPNNKVRGK